MVQNQTNGGVERKIHFYRVSVGEDESGKPLPFDPLPALKVIDKLPFNNSDEGRYEVDSDGNALCVTICDFTSQTNIKVQFGKVRRTALPQLEKAGSVTDLDLEDDAGLLEAIHVVFFPDNIVGCEYNHYRPRVSRLGGYMRAKSGKIEESVAFRLLVRKDTLEQLNRLNEVRLFEMSVYPSFTESVRHVDRGLGDALSASASVFEELKVAEVVLRPGNQGRISALRKSLSSIRGLFSQDGFSENVTRLQIRGKCGDTGRVETIDLLKDQLVSTKTVVRLNDRGRALNPESAFSAVIEAYQDNKNDIEEAAGVSF